MTTNTDTRILSIAAFVLFICGVISPFIRVLFDSHDAGVIFAIVCLLLALIFGVLGRQFSLGKVATIGALIVCAIGTINYISFCSAAKVAETEMRQQMEQHADRK